MLVHVTVFQGSVEVFSGHVFNTMTLTELRETWIVPRSGTVCKGFRLRYADVERRDVSINTQLRDITQAKQIELDLTTRRVSESVVVIPSKRAATEKKKKEEEEVEEGEDLGEEEEDQQSLLDIAGLGEGREDENEAAMPWFDARPCMPGRQLLVIDEMVVILGHGTKRRSFLVEPIWPPSRQDSFGARNDHGWEIGSSAALPIRKCAHGQVIEGQRAPPSYVW